ncbi:MAG: Gfo/Idh/MocA family oxidoreductase [Lachnospiraceae bacterium]|jgi:predicted dehydrogenase|nr:Gfo/Idh/MocA family oxidoreductase [Lachnospiraceae bacterium]
MRVGILGAGNIGGIMATTLQGMETATCTCVAARDLDRATAFAEKYHIEKAFGSYEEMLEDKGVELIYIATPHSHHYEHVKLCLEHGKHVLCEKAFTVNTAQAKEILSLAKEKKLLLAEAIWTRYMPLRKTLTELLAQEVIGKPHMLTANLGYVLNHVERMLRPELAGGALLDLGVYTLNFASMFFGNDIASIEGTAVMTDTGVDKQNNISLIYQDGRMATLCSSMMGMSDRRGIIYGDRGFLEVENINNFESITIYNQAREEVAKFGAPKQITGYEYQVDACIYAIDHGLLECPEMPHSEIILMMEWMDALRAKWNMKLPADSN